MREKIVKILEDTLRACIREGALDLEETPEITVEKPTLKEHGDFSTNLSLVLASRVKKKPREVAEIILKHLQDPSGIIESAGAAGPGFLNFTLSSKAYQETLSGILERRESYGRLEIGKGKKVLIEYVSANPTGPLHIGHGRNAVVGDVLARLLSACGYEVSKEFYVNDHGIQIQTLGRSVLYYLQKLGSSGGEIPPPPPDSYQGSYLEELVTAHRKRLESAGEDPLRVGKEAGKELLEQIQEELSRLDIEFDHFFHESSLYESGEIERTLHDLKEAGYLFVQEGATWFRSTAFGDDKDRVLIKQDGSYTYFTPDIAYHRNKYERRFDLYINIWGADHGGYIPRVKAALEALGYDAERLKVLLVQMVNLKRGGERVQMSKRSGSYVTLHEVVDEVGADAARFFFMIRSSNAQLDFDLDLAKKQSPDNPVFYIQYAHARIASIFRKASGAGHSLEGLETADLASLALPEERELIHRLTEYPEVLEDAVRGFEPHRVSFYLLDLAKVFQTYYSRAKSDPRYRVLSQEKQEARAKLALLSALKIILENGLRILGVSAPEEMTAPDEEKED
jgi:arginyl-tRNA synthetase